MPTINSSKMNKSNITEKHWQGLSVWLKIKGFDLQLKPIPYKFKTGMGNLNYKIFTLYYLVKSHTNYEIRCNLKPVCKPVLGMKQTRRA